MGSPYRWHLVSGMVQKRRAALIEFLGGKCVGCGSTRELEFNHRFGKDWRSNQFSRTQRIKRYEEDAKNDLLQLLCDNCHNDQLKHPDTCFCPKCREPVGEDF